MKKTFICLALLFCGLGSMVGSFMVAANVETVLPLSDSQIGATVGSQTYCCCPNLKYKDAIFCKLLDQCRMYYDMQHPEAAKVICEKYPSSPCKKVHDDDASIFTHPVEHVGTYQADKRAEQKTCRIQDNMAGGCRWMNDTVQCQCLASELPYTNDSISGWTTDGC
jgi:hypothetical protein